MKKLIIILVFHFLGFNTYGSIQWSKGKTVVVEQKPEIIAAPKPNKKIVVKKIKMPRYKGNLPSYAILKRPSEVKSISFSQSLSDSILYLDNINGGDEFRISVSKIIQAVEGKEIGIQATVLTGYLKNSRIIGVTSLETNSESIEVKFYQLITPEGKKFKINAQASVDGRTLINPTRYFNKRKSYILPYLGLAVGSAVLKANVKQIQTHSGLHNSNAFKTTFAEAGRESFEHLGEAELKRILKKYDVAVLIGVKFMKIVFLDSPKQEG